MIVTPTYVVSCPTSTKKILNGLYFKKGELETAKDRIRKLSEIVDTTKQPGFDQDDCQPSSYKADIIRQKEEMINCLQDELIKVRLREAENEESIRNLGEKVSELEEVCIFFRLYCSKIIPPWKCQLHKLQLFCIFKAVRAQITVKFRYIVKATKFENNLPNFLTFS